MTAPYGSSVEEESTTPEDVSSEVTAEAKWPYTRILAIVLGVVMLCGGIYAMYKLSPAPEVKA